MWALCWNNWARVDFCNMATDHSAYISTQNDISGSRSIVGKQRLLSSIILKFNGMRNSYQDNFVEGI